MKIFDVQKADYFRAGDNSLLCELMHPERTSEILPIGYSIAHATIPVKEKTLPHRLKTSTEVYIILSGQGRMHIGEETADLSAGQAVCIPPGAVQWIEQKGSEPISLLAIVEPPWREEDEECFSHEEIKEKVN